MNLTTLTDPRAVCVQAQFTRRDEAIRQLAMRLEALGKITDAEAFLVDVFQRESLGPTALGEGLAVPHGKSATVKEAAFAVATLCEPLEWEGVDGPEEVTLIFLLAIPPAEAGSTHIEVLTALTSRLADDDLRARVMAATTAEGVLTALDAAPGEQADAIQESAPTIVCVTACPAGIAHTYMAAEYLEKAGRRMGVNVVVEKQGANGIEGRLTSQQLQEARACIFAAEVAIKESERFAGIPTVSVPVAEPLRHAEALIERALALKLGAAEVWAPGELAADVRFTGAIDVVAAQATLNDACTRVYAGGTVVCMGVPSGPREIPLPMMQRFERDLLNSGMYIPEDFDAVIEWLADGRFDTSELVTDLFAIEDAAAAFERAQQNDSIKVMLQFAPE